MNPWFGFWINSVSSLNLSQIVIYFTVICALCTILLILIRSVLGKIVRDIRVGVFPFVGLHNI